jgi:hypothetical protein
LGVFRSEHARGCCFRGCREGADRAPGRRSWAFSPSFRWIFRELSLTTASVPGGFPAIETFFSLRSHLPVSPPSIVVEGVVTWRRHQSNPLCGHLFRCLSSDRSVDPRSFPSLTSGLMEPRGLPAVQVLPLMSSVYRGRNDADRVEEVVSGPRLTPRFYLYFYG